jgi:hypothetical protein
MNSKADRFLRAAILLVLSRPVLFLLTATGHVTVAHDFVFVAVVYVCTGLLVFIRLVHNARRGNQDAQIFLVPFLFYSVANAVRSILNAFYWSGVFSREAASSSGEGLALYRGPFFTVTWDQLGALLSYLAIGAVLVRRFTRSAEQEQRLATEMESARQVQAQLVPLDFPRLSGFHIDAAYLAAAEVGGDFYQVFEQNDGSVIIVIGDVCGKGLKAAMTGVLAIGVARTLASAPVLHAMEGLRSPMPVIFLPIATAKRFSSTRICRSASLPTLSTPKPTSTSIPATASRSSRMVWWRPAM